MAEVKWTLQALDDIEKIAAYIAGDSEYYARFFVSKIFESVQRIQMFPESGRIVPEVKKKNIREIILGNYRVIYRLKIDCVEILTVYHCAKLFTKNNLGDEI